MYVYMYVCTYVRTNVCMYIIIGENAVVSEDIAPSGRLTRSLVNARYISLRENNIIQSIN